MKLIGPNYGHYTGGQTNELELTVAPDGQLTWLDMQLDQKQLTYQLRRFAQQQPGKEAVLRVADGAPRESVELAIKLATEAGVSIDNPRQ